MALPTGRVAELADAQDSGSCVRKDVGVQLPPRPPIPACIVRQQDLVGALLRPRNHPATRSSTTSSQLIVNVFAAVSPIWIRPDRGRPGVGDPSVHDLHAVAVEVPRARASDRPAELDVVPAGAERDAGALSGRRRRPNGSTGRPTRSTNALDDRAVRGRAQPEQVDRVAPERRRVDVHAHACRVERPRKGAVGPRALAAHLRPGARRSRGSLRRIDREPRHARPVRRSSRTRSHRRR